MKKPICLNLSDDLVARLDAAAEADHRSRSAIVRLIVEKHLAEHAHLCSGVRLPITEMRRDAPSQPPAKLFKNTFPATRTCPGRAFFPGLSIPCQLRFRLPKTGENILTQRSEDYPVDEPWSVERQLEFDQLKRDASLWAAGLLNRDPRDSERNVRELDYESKEALRRGGYRGDLTTPTGEDSGQLTMKIKSQPSFVATFEGDPASWMQMFAPPVKLQMLLIRENESEAAWQARRQRETENFRKYGRRNPPPPPAIRTANDQSETRMPIPKGQERQRPPGTMSYNT